MYYKEKSKSVYSGGDKLSEIEVAKGKAKTLFESIGFQSQWITQKADKNLPPFADQIGKALANNGLTTSKIRSIYGEIKRIQSTGYDNAQASFFLLQPKLAYAVGREPKVVGLHLFKMLFDKAYSYVNDNKTYVNFCNMIEAVIAYHKYYVDPNKNK